MRVEEENVVEPSRPTDRETEHMAPSQSSRPKRHWLIAVIAVVVMAIVFVAGVLPRVKARETLKRETQQMAVANVLVVQPKKAAGSARNWCCQRMCSLISALRFMLARMDI